MEARRGGHQLKHALLVLRCQGKVRIHGLRPFIEQHDACGVACRDRQWLEIKDTFCRDAQRRTARYYHGQQRALLNEESDERRCIKDLLKVVEDEQ